MQTQIPAQQAQQNQSRTEHKRQESTQPQFEDSRFEATAQLRLQSLMANSAQSTQLKSVQAMMAASTPARNLGQSPSAINSVPLQRMEDEESLQAKTDEPVQREQAEVPNAENPGAETPPESTPPPKLNNTGLPDNLKTGIENLSGISMDHVKVHYNSDKPAQLQAHAYTQGSEIHVAPGQEKHLPHEAWHVVQQAQGRVRPTVQMKGGVGVNDDEGLKGEADLMGRALYLNGGSDTGGGGILASNINLSLHSIQRRVTTIEEEKIFLEDESNKTVNIITFRKTLIRTLAALTVEQKTTLEGALERYDADIGRCVNGDVNALKLLSNVIREAFPEKVYPGHARNFALPNKHEEDVRFNALVGSAVQNLLLAASAREVISDVFGEAYVVRVGERFNSASKKLAEGARGGRVLTDMTGALDEMNAGAVTNQQEGYVHMKLNFLAGTDGGAEDAISLMHEAMHLANSEINDNGGYAISPESFSTCSSEVKFNNAAHYEEVIRRILNVNPVGGKFIPKDAPHAPPRTAAQVGAGLATRILQVAWERCLNVHGFLIHCKSNPNPIYNDALLKLSSLLILSMGAKRLDSKGAVLVSDLDLVAVESIVRLLSIVNEGVQTVFHGREEGAAEDVCKLLIKKSIRANGPIFGSVNQDMMIVDALSKLPTNVSLVGAVI